MDSWSRGRTRVAVDRRALTLGVAATAATTLTAGLVATVIDRGAGVAPRSNWTFLLGLIVLAGWAAGGFVAGSVSSSVASSVARSEPLINVLLACTLVWGGWQVIAVARDASGGWSTVAVNGLLAVGAGLFGGVVSARRRP